MFKRTTALFLACLLILSMFVGCASGNQPDAELSDVKESDPIVEATPEIPIIDQSELAEYSDYLYDNYMIALDDNVSQEEFDAAVTTFMGELEEYPDSINIDGFTMQELIVSALFYVNLDELAYTYPVEKVENKLTEWENIPTDLQLERKQELAAAIDTGILDESWKSIDINAPVDSDSATIMLGKLLESTGQYKNFMGYASDEDIFGKLIFAWNSFDRLSNDIMVEKADQLNGLIQDGDITGYIVRRTSQNSMGDPERTITYGHSNIDHARQLIGLMRSEGLDSKVMLEPKTAAFLYLADWGEPFVSPEFQVTPLDDGNSIAFAKEYYLSFEFESEADKDRFDSVILQFAKKDVEDEPGLIYKSWWQPLYVSDVEMDEFYNLKDFVIDFGSMNVSTFALPENQDNVMSALDSTFTDSEIEVIDRWVNEAFFNYMNGGFK